MRVPLRKIWRAFPELDGFDDKRCRRWVDLARKRRARVDLIPMAGVFLVFLLTAGLGVFDATLGTLTSSRFQILHPVLSILVTIAVFSPLLILPIVFAMMLRDALLRRAIRHHLSDTSCIECRYSLLGLEVVKGSVRCPECGTPFRLADRGMTPGDLIAT